MLTDEQITGIATEHVKRSGADLMLQPVSFTDPDGIFFKVHRPNIQKSTNLVSPFFVRRDTGKVITVSAGQIMPGIVVKLWGWPALRADPDLQIAVVDPDLNKPRHVEVWAAIIRECMTLERAPG
jgi:hypothetical protein